MGIDYFKEENELTKKLFDLDEIISFQMEHDVQIIREADWQYLCYIDKKGFGSGLTTMGALVIGIKQFKDHSLNGYKPVNLKTMYEQIKTKENYDKL